MTGTLEQSYPETTCAMIARLMGVGATAVGLIIRDGADKDNDSPKDNNIEGPPRETREGRRSDETRNVNRLGSR